MAVSLHLWRCHDRPCATPRKSLPRNSMKLARASRVQHKYLKKMHVTRSFISLDTVPITCPEDRNAGTAGR